MMQFYWIKIKEIGAPEVISFPGIFITFQGYFFIRCIFWVNVNFFVYNSRITDFLEYKTLFLIPNLILNFVSCSGRIAELLSSESHFTEIICLVNVNIMNEWCENGNLFYWTKKCRKLYIIRKNFLKFFDRNDCNISFNCLNFGYNQKLILTESCYILYIFYCIHDFECRESFVFFQQSLLWYVGKIEGKAKTSHQNYVFHTGLSILRLGK